MYKFIFKLTKLGKKWKMYTTAVRFTGWVTLADSGYSTCRIHRRPNRSAKVKSQNQERANRINIIINKECMLCKYLELEIRDCIISKESGADGRRPPCLSCPLHTLHHGESSHV